MANQDKLAHTLIGFVVSDAMEKTIVVQVQRLVAHPKYGKVLKRSSNIQTHDEKKVAKVGDKVRIKQVRPISKNKSWALVEVLS